MKMFDMFGEMETAEEINAVARSLKEEGERENLDKLCAENGIDAELAEMFWDGEIDFVTDQLMAAVGKLDMEVKEAKGQNGYLESIANFLKAEAEKDKDYALYVDEDQQTANINIYGDITSYPWTEKDVSAYKLFNELAEESSEETYWYDTGTMNTGKARIYPKNLKQIIKGTWLSHSGIDVVASWKGKQEQYEMIIENYMQNPQLELVIKANMRKLTRQLWNYDRFLNKGTKLNEVLGLTKANMRKARDYDLGRDEIRVLRNDPDGKLSNDEVIALANAGCHYLTALRTFTTIKKIANYTQKGHDAGIWVDYLKMAKDLGYNMKDKAVLFPRKLKDKHDDLAKIMKIQGDNIREKKYQQRIPELKALYSYETSKYKIIVPESLKVIVEEGQNLHHCVGTYTEKVAEGETDILFIRKQGEEDASYYTMEVKNLEIIQYRGAYNNLHNNPVPKEIDQFVKQFHNALIKRARKAA